MADKLLGGGLGPDKTAALASSSSSKKKKASSSYTVFMCQAARQGSKRFRNINSFNLPVQTGKQTPRGRVTCPRAAPTSGLQSLCS